MNTQKQHIILRILLGLTILLLFLPLIQHSIGFPNVKKLKGAIEKVDYQSFTYADWFSGKYSKETDHYFNNNFGIRSDFVRLDNQIAYSLFDEVRAQNVIIGKENYLYEKNYIDAYTGKDYIGEASITTIVNDLKTIQDSLQGLQKELLIILAPGKATFFPEYIPDEFGSKSDTSNYHSFALKLKEQNVNHIDFNAWFLAQKGKKDYPLFPKTGIHWSHYGMILGMDSIVHKIEELTQTDLPDIETTDIEYVDERRRIDDDIEQALNIFKKLPNYKMAYPQIQFNKKGKDRLKLVSIADSFFWEMFNVGVTDSIFLEGQFWYYFNTVYPDEYKQSTSISDLNLLKSIESTDVFMMMATEGNLAHFPWGADNEFLKIFQKKYSFDARKNYKKRIEKMKEEIRSNKDWMQYIQQKAKDKNIEVDSMLTLDAIYMINQ